MPWSSGGFSFGLFVTLGVCSAVPRVSFHYLVALSWGYALQFRGFRFNVELLYTGDFLSYN
jgi:hypothetical protein